jgi:hypothetical protein
MCWDSIAANLPPGLSLRYGGIVGITIALASYQILEDTCAYPQCAANSDPEKN